MTAAAKKITSRSPINAGFSLIEISIILTILAVFATSIITSGSVTQEYRDVETDDDRRAKVIEMLGYYTHKKRGHLPCPARRDVPDRHADFGDAGDCTGNPTCVAASSPPGTLDVRPTGGADTDCIRIGAVPVRELGLPVRYAYDGWGRRLTYAVVKKLATGSSDYSGYTTALTNGVIEVKDAVGASVLPGGTENVVSYVLISHGKDGKGGFLPSGQSLPCAAAATELDDENCDGDAAFTASVVSDQARGASYYYDFMDWQQFAAGEEEETEAMVSVGTSHTCAVKTDGTAWCWGENANGALGNNTTNPSTVPVQVVGPGGSGFLTDVAQISAGTGRTCAVKTDGTAWCWGWNQFGEIGDGTSGTNRLAPVQVALTDAAQISTGTNHTCAVKTDNTAWCWGGNNIGQLGDNTNNQRNTPVQVKGPGGASFLTGVGEISAGGTHTCAVKKTDNTAWCWGYNWWGALGDGTTTDRWTPVQVANFGGGFFTGVAHISAGEGYTCAVKTDGTPWCWKRYESGGNYYIGLSNSGYNGNYPNQVESAPFIPLSGIKDVDASWDHTCATKPDGTAWCWGFNTMGQRGDGTSPYVPTGPAAQVQGPGGIGFLNDVAQISAGGSQSCAVKTDGTFWCWGNNAQGQLGDGTTTQRNAPVQVTPF